jgi:2-methylcitrate dehydratase PrpD
MVESLPGGSVPEDVNVADTVARFAADTSFGDLPPSLIDRAKKSVLDLLGVTIYGAASESAETFLNYVLAQGGRPESTIASNARLTSAYNAALINGMFAHATELSETFTRAAVHPGNVILPGLLAVAEREHATGRQVVVATAISYELLVRMGLSVGVPWLLDQGFHTPSALGVFGSAAGCAKVLDLPFEDMRNAISIASCLSPTALSAAFGGATIKELLEGSSSATGVLCADLARAGITGVTDWDKHWYKAMARVSSPVALVDELGESWRIDSGGLHFKQRAVMALGQPVLDVIEQLLRTNTIEPGHIEHVGIEASGRIVVGGEPHPTTMVGAKASSQFLAAFALTHQKEFLDDPHFIHSMTPDNLGDRATHELSDRITTAVDEKIDFEFEKGWPVKFAARVRIDMRDGRQLTEYVDIWPKTSRLSFSEVADKFRRVVAGHLDEARSNRVVEMVGNLESVADMGELVSLIGA